MEPEPLTWRNVYDVGAVEIDRPSTYEAIDLDGSGLVYSAFGSVLANYGTLVGEELGSIDEQVLTRDGDRRLLWRIWLESEREGGAPADFSIQPYDYDANKLALSHFAELEANGNGIPIIARGARMMLPLGRMFDASATVDPGWYEADVALSYSFRTETRGSMTGVIGFAITEQALREIVVPALTVGLAMVWNLRPESQELQTLDLDGDDLVTTADVTRWVESLAQPNFDSDDDGEDDLYAFTFGFRASRTCGGNDFGCSP